MPGKVTLVGPSGTTSTNRPTLTWNADAAATWYEMWLDKDHWWGDWQYNYAFLGWPHRTLNELFGAAGMQVVPEKILYLAEPDDPAQAFRLHVDSIGQGSFTWKATVTSDSPWLEIRPLSGVTGQDVDVIITPANRRPGTYETTIRFLAEGQEVQNGEKAIPVVLEVKRRIHSNYLPTIMADSP